MDHADRCDTIHRDLKCDQLLLQPDPPGAAGATYARLNSGQPLPAETGAQGEGLLRMRLLISDFGEGKQLHKRDAASGEMVETDARTRMLTFDAAGNAVADTLGGFANAEFRAPEVRCLSGNACPETPPACAG